MPISRYSNRWNSTKIIYLFSVLSIVHFVFAYGQDPCNRYRQNCVAYSKCLNAAELIYNRRALQCGFEQNGEVKICCDPPRNLHTANYAYPPMWAPVPSVRSPIPPAVPAAPPTPTNIRPSEVAPAFKPNPKLPSQNSATSARIKNAAAIAQLNCEEYTKYRIEKMWIDPDLPGEEGYWKEKADCVVTLITGGTKAEPKEYPHMALIGYGNDFNTVQWSCGGTLISERFILSAAHCGKTSGLGAPKWVLLGDLNITSKTDDAKPAVYKIIKVHDHPNYKPPSYYHDISLFELNTTVAMSPYVRPACLHTSASSNLIGTSASITGWGALGHGYRQSNHLLKATISVMEDNRCKDSYENKNDVRLTRGYDPTTMICAGDYSGTNDTCSGDSGGPLQMTFGEKKLACMWNIIGVTSFGKICGNTEEPDPGVYTKVAYYLDWIQSIVWP